MGRITWVCATCSEPSTRRYGANRHNNNLHGGKGTVVRLLDYITGIATGRFLPRDDNVPSGRKARQSSFFDLKLRDNYQKTTSRLFMRIYRLDRHTSKLILALSTPIASRIQRTISITIRGHEREDNHRNAIKLPSGTGLAPSIDEVQTRPKLQEIHLLLNKYYPHNHANQFFAVVNHIAIIGNDENIDRILVFLREVDRQLVNYGNLYDMLSNGTDKMDKLDLNLPQEISSPERYLQGKATLAAIEQLLSPYYPQEFVRNVITCLTIEFDITRDLSSLNTAFENHLKNVQRHMHSTESPKNGV